MESLCLIVMNTSISFIVYKYLIVWLWIQSSIFSLNQRFLPCPPISLNFNRYNAAEGASLEQKLNWYREHRHTLLSLQDRHLANKDEEEIKRWAASPDANGCNTLTDCTKFTRKGALQEMTGR